MIRSCQTEQKLANTLSVDSKHQPLKATSLATAVPNTSTQNQSTLNKTSAPSKKTNVLNQRARLGQWAEQQAAQHLLQQGWCIVACNYHSRYGEIDVIASQGEQLIMLEVKARSKGSYAAAVEVVSLAKQRRLIKTSMLFLQQHPQFLQHAVRFDVMCFDFAEKIAKTVQQDFAQLRYDVDWIENAFTLDFESFTLATDLW